MNGRALLVAITRICVAVAGLSSAAAVILAVRYQPTPRSVVIALLAVAFLSVPLMCRGRMIPDLLAVLGAMDYVLADIDR